MYYCTTQNFEDRQDHFVCSNYKSNTGSCQIHFIREQVLYRLVLSCIQRTLAYVRMFWEDFTQEMLAQDEASRRAELEQKRRALTGARRRMEDLDKIIQHIYEDNVLGKISNEQFRMLSADYNTEQKQLAAAIPEKQAKLEKLKASAANVDAFIEKASRYTDITDLTPELLWLFIERIDIGERPGRYNRNGMQEVRIIYRDIGIVDSTLSAEDAENAEVHFIPSLEMVVQQMTAQTQVS